MDKIYQFNKTNRRFKLENSKILKPKSKMQFRNIFLLLLTGLLLFAADSALAQKITTNENGDKIILYPDGSWRYFDSRLDNVSDKYEPEESSISNEIALNESDRVQVIKDYRKVLINAAERAAADEKLAIRNYDDVQFERVLVEEELDQALKDPESSKSEINEIKQRLKEAEQKEKDSLESLNVSVDAATEAENKTLLTDEEIYNLIFVDGRTTSSVENTKINTGNNNSSRADKETKKIFASYNPKNDVMIFPPTRNCNVVFDGVDDFSGKKRKEIGKESLFSYTADEMRPYFKDKDYIKCEAYLSSLSGGFKFLSLEITIASENAQRDYGIIEKGSILNIKLMDESNIKLFNNKTDVGILNELDKSVTFQAQYVVSSGDEKILRKTEVDKIRLIWSSGYEDYEIYDLDFFINQFRCLNEK